jgi:hypothetical protein
LAFLDEMVQPARDLRCVDPLLFVELPDSCIAPRETCKLN